MKEAENPQLSFSGKSIARNTLYNLLGNIIPILFAILFIPPLIKGLGAERFGILSIAWMIIGYFSFFDFGIGRGLTKIVSELIESKQSEKISEIFWTSVLLLFSVSLVFTIFLLFFVPTFVQIFNISEELRDETENIFFILALAIPIVTTMASFRGMLEAYQKFAIINILKVILGALTFLGPLVVLVITNSLFWIIVFLIFIRIIIWVLYLFQCFRINKSVRKKIEFNFNSFQPVLKFSIWITLGNIVVPLILYSDRFLIGTLISAAAITYYVTPYEVITKLILIPDALSGVLFPVFSASFVFNPEITKKMFKRGAKFIFLIVYPIVFLVLTFAYEILDIWLGFEFAQKSHLILQFLAIGVMMNCISLIPTNFFQGIGKPKIITLIVLMELPFYLSAMWFAIHSAGIDGAALVFMVAATVNVSILYFIAFRYYGIKLVGKFKGIIIISFFAMLILPFIVVSLSLKLLLAITFCAIFFIVTWKIILTDEEKLFIVSKLKLRIN